MSALPKAIQQQAELAEQIERQLAQGQAVEGTPVSADPGIPPSVPVTPAPAVAEAAQPVEAKPDAQPKAEPDNVWQRRYESLQGKYNAEVPQLHSQLRAQGEQLQTLSQQLQEVKNAKPAEPEKPLVSKEDETAFGADLIDLIRRVSSAEIARASKDVTGKLEGKLQEITAKVGTVSQVQAMSAEQQFWTDLTKEVPDWQEINTNQDFLNWLASINPMAGVQYQQLLANAQQRLNVKQVAAIFDAWKNEQGITPASKPAPTQADQNRRELESLAAPTASRSTQPATDAQGDKRVWTGEEYAAAYDPRATKSKPVAEVEALRRAADQAVAEGRVRW